MLLVVDVQDRSRRGGRDPRPSAPPRRRAGPGGGQQGRHGARRERRAGLPHTRARGPGPGLGAARAQPGDLLDKVVAVLPDEGAEEAEEPEEPRFAIVGRPNVGKSSLFNRLVGEERSVVYEEAGTTRDAVDALVTWPDGPVRFVDTAGLRRLSRVQGVEYYSFLRAERAIERAATSPCSCWTPLKGSPVRTSGSPPGWMEVGRGLVVVANKWDLVQERDRTFKELAELLVPYARAPMLRTSAIGGTGVHRLPAVLSQVHERWSRRAPTARVNEIVAAAQAEQQAPGDPVPVRHAGGRRRRRGSSCSERRPPRRATSGSSRAVCAAPSTSRAFRSASASVRACGAAPASRSPGRRRPRFDPTGRLRSTGRGAAWLARSTGGQEVAGSNPAGPTSRENASNA